ncbi:XRE family transcriptional regulator [Cupriavidus basilensis OR16]|uniref:XRE family transcriptional regulator n=1 Tax=Cupriavidus basilensis OR16 TaxID=1127483 RepID=H1SI35_9BURK|nr:hypothetical protein [Cupriavidus basilensis]EHP37817.1 XRE family transcriptional regulator [Cupriavidus basilensis OR16]
MAAQTASVSYRGDLTEAMLEHTLATGQAPPGFEAHVARLLDEAPICLVVMAVAQTARRRGMPAAEVWRHVARFARLYSIHRQALWIEASPTAGCRRRGDDEPSRSRVRRSSFGVTSFGFILSQVDIDRQCRTENMQGAIDGINNEWGISGQHCTDLPIL